MASAKHPRLETLKAQVSNLPVDEVHQQSMLRVIDQHMDRILTRDGGGREQIDDLEAVQQASMAALMEQALERACDPCHWSTLTTRFDA